MAVPDERGDWSDWNQYVLRAELQRMRTILSNRAAVVRGEPAASPVAPVVLPDGAPLPALDELSERFELSRFERDLLLLCAGIELDGAFAHLCAEAHGNPQMTYPTFSLAFAALTAPFWGALAPTSVLRRRCLIELRDSSALTNAPLRAAEAVVHFLAGIRAPDERLRRLVTPIAAVSDLPPSQLAVVERLVTLWAQSEDVLPVPMQLCGESADDLRAIAVQACQRLNLQLYALHAARLPGSAAELDQLMALWERDAVLLNSVLLLELDDLDGADGAQLHTVERLVEQLAAPLLLSTRFRRPLRRPTVTLDVHKPTAAEQRALWQEMLGGHRAVLAPAVDRLVGQFNLSLAAIRSAGTEALRHVTGNGSTPSDELTAMLWDVCRVHTRARLDDLAQRMVPAAGWNDLVLPDDQRLILRDIAAHVRRRTTVYEHWGFAAQSSRGLGISALFAGVSGTGKTTAAEVLADALRLDLYRVDLSAVVSKYIGETEKNLRRIFDAAEAGGAILLFDEADALFGKRSDVKDSHDRYANIEVSYLLQRMESYPGLSILTTNMKSALDQAFLRRIRFVVQFPFPDAVQRADIWRRVFPPATPTDGLDIEKLARLNVAGGNIRNIALNAAFFAADSGTPVRMVHLLQAAQIEYAKQEKPLTDAEVAGWI